MTMSVASAPVVAVILYAFVVGATKPPVTVITLWVFISIGDPVGSPVPRSSSCICISTLVRISPDVHNTSTVLVTGAITTNIQSLVTPRAFMLTFSCPVLAPGS